MANKMQDLIKFIKGFKYAGEGVINTIITERNMRVHLVCMIYMYSILGLTDWFTLTRTDWALLFIANAVVMAGELINTAIESVVNLVSPDFHPLAKKAKDAAAGAVLVCAVFAVCIGLCVLFQKEAFISMFEYFKTHISMLVLFVISFIIACVFMLRGIPHRKEK